MPDQQAFVIEAIQSLIERRGGDISIVKPETDLYDDLELDSLEVAELSAMLEDELGTDPYSAGLLPRTVTEVAGFYAG